MSGHGTDPIATLLGINYAPATDYHISIGIATDGRIGVSVLHDGFPAQELRINGQSVYRFDPRATGTGPMSMFPPMNVLSPLFMIPSSQPMFLHDRTDRP